ncbi:MAG: nickel pincer cofactor biosynthesis protein LarC [Sedimentisphaerales bacterium]|nr:nickel pincer cofactor biosynthesis protein LarC [Sedimentisphaerales bacterium]
MKIAYFDCFSGAAGDMIVGACLDAGVSSDYLRSELARLGLEQVELKIEKVSKNGIAATRFQPIIKNDHHHHHHSDSDASDPGHCREHKHPAHRNLQAIIEIINRAGFSDKVTQQAVKIFQRLARAEAKVHGTTEDKIHFHEVGADDAIMDIVGSCLALEALGIEKVFCSRLTVGGGTVRCEHGVLPVPAPATVELIKDIEITPSDAQVELLTPTGAAILTGLADSFGAMPPMKIAGSGYGAGQRDIAEFPNVLRLLVGEAAESGQQANVDEVCVLEANIDDATAELIGYVSEKLLEAGALDVYCTAIVMKKNRPGTWITVLCRPADAVGMEQIMFRESTTFGIRRHSCRRSILPRDYCTVDSPYGKIRIKQGYFDGSVITGSVEFDDCRKAAEKHNVPVRQVISAVMTAYKHEKP